ncbi:MAG TPA: hypothetical protein VLM80_08535 [Anaerolineales bacterium]|nr:hypothetical protein [Anaerolineales bacterium]
MFAWAEQDIGASVQPLTGDAWTALLIGAGLKVIHAKTNAINIEDETKGIIGRYGFAGMLKVLGRMMKLYIKSPDYRKFVKGARQGGIVPEKLDEYFGYGLFVGQKDFT